MSNEEKIDQGSAEQVTPTPTTEPAKVLDQMQVPQSPVTSPEEVLLAHKRVTGFSHSGQRPSIAAKYDDLPTVAPGYNSRELVGQVGGQSKGSIYDERMSDGRPKMGTQFIDRPTSWIPPNVLPQEDGWYLVKITEVRVETKWFSGRLTSPRWETDVPFIGWMPIPK